MSQKPDSERRRSFRVNDHVGLRLGVIPKEELDDIEAAFKRWRREHGLINQFLHQRDQLLPLITGIQNNLPDVAAYLRHLETKIDALAGLIQARDQDLPRSPSHSVNLSANGIRLYHDQAIAEGTVVQIQLVLFPGLAIIPAVGTVIESHEEQLEGEPRHQLTIDFTLMDDDDRELLTTHTVTAQMRALQHQNLHD